MNITKRAKDIKQQWYLVDAENKVLGRLATRIADILMGKKKEYYSHDIVCGDYVVVTNAKKIKLTANKLEKKVYRWHTGYPGGLKERTAGEILERKPEYLLIHAVKGMLPKNKLRAKLLKNLKVYVGEEHPHSAQQPEILELVEKKFKKHIEKIEQAEVGKVEKKEEEKPAEKTQQVETKKIEKKEAEKPEEKAQQVEAKKVEKKEAEKSTKKAQPVEAKKVEKKEAEKPTKKAQQTKKVEKKDAKNILHKQKK